MHNGVAITGMLIAVLKDSNGVVKDKTTVDNLVVTTGKNHIADQMSNQADASMSHMAIGTGSTSQLLTDTILETELSRKVFTSKSQGSGGNANQVTFIADWPAGEGTGSIAEAGIFNAVTSGVMMCRTTFPVKNKGVGDSITMTWTITIN